MFVKICVQCFVWKFTCYNFRGNLFVKSAAKFILTVLGYRFRCKKCVGLTYIYYSTFVKEVFALTESMAQFTTKYKGK